MKISSESFTDFLSYGSMIRDYLVHTGKNRSYIDWDDVMLFSKIMKLKLDNGKVFVHNIFDVKWMTQERIKRSLLSLITNDILELKKDKEIITPDNIPFELVVS